MEARAIAKHVRISPLKVGYICDEIRGKQVDEALAILQFTPKRGAAELENVLKSAVANAENNLNLDRERLYVKEAYANDGPHLKRFKPRARGMADTMLKRSSHLGIVVEERD